MSGNQCVRFCRKACFNSLHPNGVKTDMGEYNVSRPVEKDAELNESFDWENSSSSLNFKGQQLPWRSTAPSGQVIIVSH